MRANLFKKRANTFNEHYNRSWEDEAQAQRGEFLDRFPLRSVSRLTLKRFAIGQNGRETFCYWVEPGTRKWAQIVGASANKFGIYYGKTKSDRSKRFRYSLKFSEGLPRKGAERRVFSNVRKALVELLDAGDSREFDRIDSNPLSQMFKAKILSLYYPKHYLAICSRDHLQDLAKKLGLNTSSPSRIQHYALKAKRLMPEINAWSNLKFAAFLWEDVLQQGAVYREIRTATSLPSQRKHSEVDFEALMRKWREKGEKSEAYALEFERSRLRANGLGHLARQIQDCTRRPGYGYDFVSFTTARTRRYIEVKTLNQANDAESRFFVTEHERLTAASKDMKSNYYFYFVIYSNKEPVEVQVWTGETLYKVARLEPMHYLVRVRS